MLSFRQGGAGLSVSTAASNTTTALPADATGTVVRVANPSTTLSIYVRLGISSTTAAATDAAVPPMGVAFFDRSATDTHVCTFASGAGPTLVNIAVGEARFR